MTLSLAAKTQKPIYYCTMTVPPSGQVFILRIKPALNESQSLEETWAKLFHYPHIPVLQEFLDALFLQKTKANSDVRVTENFVLRDLDGGL
jgi:hypothetical protein